MMIKRAKNIKFDEFDSREEKNFDFQNLKRGKPFLNIKIFSSVCIWRFLSIFAFYFDLDRLNLKICHRFSNDCCFNAFMCRANLHLFFINFILYRFLFWYDRFNILLCEKDNKITWVQSHVTLPFMIKFLKSLFWGNFSSNFNLLNFVLWFSNLRVSEGRPFFEFCFYCCYSVSIVFNLLFLFSVYRI